MKQMIIVLVLYMASALGHSTIAQEIIYARLQTSKGNIDLALYPEKAPLTVGNFIQYAESGYYDRLIFHRVVKGKLIQTGGLTKYYGKRHTQDPIKNEADNGLNNRRGTVAMARYMDPHSATSQFFFNVKDNPELDHIGKDLMMEWGYTVFGEVVAGMEVVDAIANVETGAAGPLEKDVPLKQIILKRVDVIEASQLGALPN